MRRFSCGNSNSRSESKKVDAGGAPTRGKTIRGGKPPGPPKGRADRFGGARRRRASGNATAPDQASRSAATRAGLPGGDYRTTGFFLQRSFMVSTRSVEKIRAAMMIRTAKTAIM
jgi:hypothetical protein